MHDPSLTLKLLTSAGGIGFIPLQIVGIAIPLLCLGIIGRFLKYEIFATQKPNLETWCTNIVVGMAAGSIYFVIRSFLANMVSWVPGYVEGEFLMLAFAGMVFQRKKLAEPRFSMHRRDWIALVAFFLAYLFFGRWHLFSFDFVSSDPAVISILLENSRRLGAIASQLPHGNPVFPDYPAGLQVIAGILYNPLLTTHAIVQSWPSLAYTLTVGIIAEHLINHKGVSRGLLWLAFFYLLTKYIWPFDLNTKRRALEGVTKHTLYFATALPILLFIVRPVFKRPIFAFVLYGWLAMLPFFINPVNFYVSTLCMLIVIAYFLWFRFLNAKLFTISMAALGMACLVFWVQDPFFNKVVGTYAPACHVYSSTPAPCNLDASVLAQIDNVRVKTTPVHGGEQNWYAFIPPVLKNPWGILAAHNLNIYLSTPAENFAWILIGLGFAITLWRKPWRYQWRFYAGFIILLLAAPLMIFQVYLMVRFGPVATLHLVRDYTGIVYQNIFIPILLCMIFWSCMQICAAAQLPLNPKVRRIGYGLLSLVFISMLYRGHRGVMSVKKQIHIKFGFHSDMYAKTLLEVDQIVPDDVRVLLPWMPMRVFNERWVFPEYASVLAQIYMPNEFHGSFPQFWQPSERDVFAHHHAMCQDFCDYAAKEHLSYLVGFSGYQHMCGGTILELAQRVKCLDIKVESTIENHGTFYLMAINPT